MKHQFIKFTKYVDLKLYDKHHYYWNKGVIVLLIMSNSSIKNICVIGAGNMGAKIAGLIATQTPVLLLDIADKNSENKNSKIISAVQDLKTSKPNALWHPKFAGNIKIGNLEDDLDILKEYDLIIEAIVENLDIKASLFDKIADYVNDTCVIASNTSTFCLKNLKAHIKNHKIRKNIVIMHFFNPPLHMKLLEFIHDNDLNESVLENLRNFCACNLGKSIIECNDTPGFIGNRVGCFLLNCSLYYADLFNVKYEVIDQIFSQVFKLPNTGIFGLYDLIGIDVVNFINESLKKSLNQDDRYHKFISNKLSKLISLGALGRKSKYGFYDYRDKEKKVIEHENSDFFNKYISLVDSERYDITKIIEEKSEVAECIRYIVTELVMYAINIIGTTTNEFEDIDIAMKLGYGFDTGIFEFCKKVENSFDLVNKFAISKKIKVPENFDSTVSKIKLKQSSIPNNDLQNTEKVIFESEDADLCAVKLMNGREVLRFAFKTKMNMFTTNVFTFLAKSIDYAEKYNMPIYVYNKFKYFSVGGDLKYFYNNALNNRFDLVSDFVKIGQETNMRIKYCKVPFICCAKGFALGGGAEIMLHSSHIIALPDLKAGLVEVNIGLIPAWGGFKEMMLISDTAEKLQKNILTILDGYKSKTAYEFVENYHVNNLKVVMHENAFLTENIEIQQKNSKVVLDKVILPKINLRNLLDLTKYDDHTRFIVDLIGNAIADREYTEAQLLQIEHDIFIEVIKQKSAQNKIRNIIGA